MSGMNLNRLHKIGGSVVVGQLEPPECGRKWLAWTRAKWACFAAQGVQRYLFVGCRNYNCGHGFFSCLLSASHFLQCSTFAFLTRPMSCFCSRRGWLRLATLKKTTH